MTTFSFKDGTAAVVSPDELQQYEDWPSAFHDCCKDYRFYEIIHVYGPTIKAIVHEMFGDGIVSAIDFEMDIQKVDDPKGARVLVTMNGKFLPYRKW